MEQSRLISKMILKLKMAYPYYFKELTNEEILGLTSLYNEELGQYNEITLNNAISNIIRNNKYMPSLKELIDECENNKQHIKNEIIDKMLNDGYFKSTREYEKALHFVEENVIPDWFKKDMSHYYNLMIEQSQVKMIR